MTRETSKDFDRQSFKQIKSIAKRFDFFSITQQLITAIIGGCDRNA
jgi:hypothetical protein